MEGGREGGGRGGREKEVNEAAKGAVPTNTKKNNAWAERTFDAWVQE